MKRILWVVLLNLFLCGNIFGEGLLDNGIGVLRICESGLDSHNQFDLGVCLGFLTSLQHINNILQARDDLCHFKVKNEYTYCVPENAIGEQIPRIIMKYLKDNPDKLNQPSIFLALKALHEAWPCKQG